MVHKKLEIDTNTSGKPGRSNRLIGLRILLIPSFLCILFSLLGLYFYQTSRSPIILIFFILTSVIYFIYRKIEKEIDRTYEKGAEGEEKVFRYLREILPSEYYILNDMKIPNMERANIDHIVIGPNGIFIIETKNYSGKVTIKDKKIHIRGKLYQKDIIKQVWHQTFSLRDFLKRITGRSRLKIQPVVVFSNAYVANPGEVSGVQIIPLSFLKKYLLTKKSSIILTDDLNKRLFEILKRYANKPLS